MNVTPVKGHYVLDIPDLREVKGDMIISEERQTNAAPVIGTVIMSHPDNEYPAGTKLVFRKYAVDELKLFTPEGEDIVFILDGRDILGVVTS